MSPSQLTSAFRDGKVQIVFDDIRGSYWNQYGNEMVVAPTSEAELEILNGCIKSSVLPRLQRELFEAQD